MSAWDQPSDWYGRRAECFLERSELVAITDAQTLKGLDRYAIISGERARILERIVEPMLAALLRGWETPPGEGPILLELRMRTLTKFEQDILKEPVP